MNSLPMTWDSAWLRIQVASSFSDPLADLTILSLSPPKDNHVKTLNPKSNLDTN